MSTTGSGMYWSGAMRCPKCRSDMDMIDVDGTAIDRCSSCHGIWFDAGEIERLLSKKTAVAIDIGDPESGKVQNSIDRYGCPRCGGDMIRLVDAKQTHIWYEACPECSGMFFDAGEFTDLKYDTLMDRVRDFVKGSRPGD